MDLIHNITLFKKSLGLIFSFKARRSGLIPKVEVLLGLYYPNAQSASHHLLLLVPPVLFVNDSSSHSGWALVVVVSCQLLINQSQCLVHEYVLFKQKSIIYFLGSVHMLWMFHFSGRTQSELCLRRSKKESLRRLWGEELAPGKKVCLILGQTWGQMCGSLPEK